MAARSPLINVTDALSPAEVKEHFAAWWNQFLGNHYHSDHSKACKDIFGLAPSGAIRNRQSACEWRTTDNLKMPSQQSLDSILKKATQKAKKKVQIENLVLHKIPYKEPAIARRTMGKNKSNGADTAPLFTVADGVPAPQIQVLHSEYDGQHKVLIEAHLPLAGVLAIMAMLDDAQ